MSGKAPSDVSVGIEFWSQKTPENIAIIHEERSLTFAEVNREISSFAALLDDVVDRSTLLPILVGVNLNSYLAIMAAMRAGIGFSPIDSSNPPEAIVEILQEIGNPKHMVITEPDADHYVPSGCTALKVETSRESDFQSRSVEKSDLGMVLFTSGSTGKPKGVMLNWAAIDDINTEHIRYLAELNDIVRLGVHNSLGFLFGFWRALTVAHGYSIAIQDPFKYTADELISKINEAEVSHMGLVPSLLEKIADGRSPENRCIKVVHATLAGESTNWDQVEKIRGLTNPLVEIKTMYGSSEIQFLAFEHMPGDSHGVGKLPFSRIPHPQRILLKPISEESSLLELILFEPIASGYFNDPELTKQKFGVDENGRRFLRSGDLLKRDADGLLTHAGRIDDLVKINGRLVEPSESERVLRDIPGVESVAVLPHLDSSQKPFLVAHLKIANNSEINPNQIYEILLAKLASNLVPSMLVKHTYLPLNDRGKLDRQLLINSSWERWSIKTDATALTDTETFTQNCMREILRQPNLDIDEDLFGVGMDSFAALEFIAMSREYGFTDFTPNIFLENRSIKSVARMLDSKREQDPDSPRILNLVGRKEPIFCMPGGGMTALWYREFAIEVGSNQPLAIIEARGLHTDDLPDRSIEEHGARALTQILRIQPSGAVQIIGHSAGGTVAYEVATQLAKQGREVKLVLLDSHAALEKLRTPSTSWKIIFLAKRVKKMFMRPFAENFSAITRRINSLRFVITSGRTGSQKAKYDRFTMLALESNKNYQPQEPTFPILLLYVQGAERHEIWKTIPTLSTVLVSGTHVNLTEQPYVKEVAQRSLLWLNEKVPQVLQ